MTGRVRIDEYVGRARPRERRSGPRKDAPTWALIVCIVLVIIGAIMIVSLNHPMLYGFVGSIVATIIVSVALDRSLPAWVEGYVDAEMDSTGMRFRAERRAVWLAILQLFVLLAASFFFIATLSAGLNLGRFYVAYGLVIAWAVVHTIWMLWTVSRWVELRLDAEGVTASGPLRRAVTIPWGSLAMVFAVGDRLFLATTTGLVRWPVRQLLSDPDVVAEIITRCTEVPGADDTTARAIIDGMIAEKRPWR